MSYGNRSGDRQVSDTRKRGVRTWDEEDAYTGWRKVLACFSRPGAVKKVKQSTHRRERRVSKRAEIREELDNL